MMSEVVGSFPPEDWRWIVDVDLGECVDRTRVPGGTPAAPGEGDAAACFDLVGLLLAPHADDWELDFSDGRGRWFGHRIEWRTDAPAGMRDVTIEAIDLFASLPAARGWLAEHCSAPDALAQLEAAGAAGANHAAELALELRGGAGGG